MTLNRLLKVTMTICYMNSGTENCTITYLKVVTRVCDNRKMQCVQKCSVLNLESG